MAKIFLYKIYIYRRLFATWLVYGTLMAIAVIDWATYKISSVLLICLVGWRFFWPIAMENIASAFLMWLVLIVAIGVCRNIRKIFTISIVARFMAALGCAIAKIMKKITGKNIYVPPSMPHVFGGAPANFPKTIPNAQGNVPTNNALSNDQCQIPFELPCAGPYAGAVPEDVSVSGASDADDVPRHSPPVVADIFLGPGDYTSKDDISSDNQDKMPFELPCAGILRGPLGEGDIKLMSVCALFLSMEQLGSFVLYTGLFGIVFACLTRARVIPFAPAIACGFMLAWR